MKSSNINENSIEWSKDTIVLETEISSWTRMAKLQDGSWLAAYAILKDPSFIRIKRSQDNMRTWSFVCDIAEAKRQMDNANLLQLTDGTVLLAIRSIAEPSYRIEVYRSQDNGNSFQFLSTVDWDKNTGRGLWEPFLFQLPSGNVAVFYANETHQPRYSQTLSEKISKDNGVTWEDSEILAVAVPDWRSRPGEPNVSFFKGKFSLFYENCGSEQCVGHVSYSLDGVTWDGKIGESIPATWQNAQATPFDDALVVTSNSHQIILRVGESWVIQKTQPFNAGSWAALYQVTPDEIAIVVSDGGQYLKLGHSEQYKFLKPYLPGQKI